MPDDPDAPAKTTKVTPHLLPAVNEYGRHPSALGPATDADEPDLVRELDRRGIPHDEGDEQYLGDTDVWPAETRRDLLAVVELAERLGVPFRLSFEHVGTPVTLTEITISLSGH